jgi:hypothetical protein
VANLDEVLHVYRETGKSVCREKGDIIMDRVVTISAENLAYWAGMTSPSDQCVNIAALANLVFHRIETVPDLAAMGRIIASATEAIARHYPEFRRSLEERAKVRLRIIRHNYVRYRLRNLFGRIAAGIGGRQQ